MSFLFRALKAEEIECRVGQIYSTEKGTRCTLLLYKDARCDMSILDEVFTPLGWQRDHKEVKGNMYAGIGIRDKDGWIWKWDCGTESNTEAEKGEASDSFKRAGVNWGIGRELYTAPHIVVALSDNEVTKNKAGKLQLAGKFFSVKKIEYIEESSKRRISALEIEDKNGDSRYSYAAKITEAQRRSITSACTSEEIAAICKSRGVKQIYQITEKQADGIITGLKAKGRIQE